MMRFILLLGFTILLACLLTASGNKHDSPLEENYEGFDYVKIRKAIRDIGEKVRRAISNRPCVEITSSTNPEDLKDMDPDCLPVPGSDRDFVLKASEHLGKSNLFSKVKEQAAELTVSVTTAKNDASVQNVQDKGSQNRQDKTGEDSLLLANQTLSESIKQNDSKVTSPVTTSQPKVVDGQEIQSSSSDVAPHQNFKFKSPVIQESFTTEGFFDKGKFATANPEKVHSKAIYHSSQTANPEKVGSKTTSRLGQDAEGQKTSPNAILPKDDAQDISNRLAVTHERTEQTTSESPALHNKKEQSKSILWDSFQSVSTQDSDIPEVSHNKNANDDKNVSSSKEVKIDDKLNAILFENKSDDNQPVIDEVETIVHQEFDVHVIAQQAPGFAGQEQIALGSHDRDMVSINIKLSSVVAGWAAGFFGTFVIIAILAAYFRSNERKARKFTVLKVVEEGHHTAGYQKVRMSEFNTEDYGNMATTKI